MEFTEFANLLKPVIGGSYNTKVFTRTLFESMMPIEDSELIEDVSDETFKAYFNGNTSITKIAKLVLAHLEDENFVCYLEGFGDATTQLLCDTFAPYIEGINQMTAARDITDLFVDILHKAAGAEKKKSTPKGAKNGSKTSHDILTDKILASGQALADTWGKAIEGLASATNNISTMEVEKIELPDTHSSNDLPYSSEDQILLKDFTADYDEIMTSLIGEDFASSLIDMTLPAKIKNLYETKWDSKAGSFQNPTLKSYVFALLGELNQLSDSFLTKSSGSFSINKTRIKVRNLYVKLHPDSFSDTFPYDAFIDDWSDGEI